MGNIQPLPFDQYTYISRSNDFPIDRLRSDSVGSHVFGQVKIAAEKRNFRSLIRSNAYNQPITQRLGRSTSKVSFGFNDESHPLYEMKPLMYTSTHRYVKVSVVKYPMNLIMNVTYYELETLW